MRTALAVCVFVGVMIATDANAQYPDQFYTNGVHIDVWRTETEKGQKSTLWFCREPGDKITYKESLAVIYDNKPEYVYFIDLGTRKFVGRYSFIQDKYSILPEDARRQNKDDIPEDAFPEPGELPTVAQLISGSQNQNTLLDPPPTKLYFMPGLKTSSWNSTYFTDQRLRIQAKVSFNGGKGTYTFRADGREFLGTLNDVRYEVTDQDLFLIRGTWILGDNQRYFRFTIAPDNLNTFQGEWGRNGAIEGSWSGTRLRDE